MFRLAFNDFCRFRLSNLSMNFYIVRYVQNMTTKVFSPFFISHLRPRIYLFGYGEIMRQINDEEWEAIKNDHPFLKKSLFEECKDSFGTVNIFAIIGAADLIGHRVGDTSFIKDGQQVRRRCWDAHGVNRADRFKFEDIAGAYHDHMIARAQVYNGINHAIGFHGWRNVDFRAYFKAMDEADLWDVVWDAGAKKEEEFEQIYPTARRVITKDNWASFWYSD